MKTGLTLGKYAPLHKGHQYLIDKALSEMDKLKIVIYNAPETINIPLNVRSGWIKAIYPQTDLIEAWDGPTVIGDTPEIKQIQEDYIIRTLGITNITAFYSSEFYGEHMSKALGARDARVDSSRTQVPISATLIRKDPFKYRDFLHPIVYRDFVSNIVFLGAPSSGKSTIAERMAKEFNTVFMPEYGREYWDLHQVNRRLSQEQLLELAQGHIEGEDSLVQEANKYLFIDTNAITTYLFSLDYHGAAHPMLEELAEKTASRYDLFFVCDIDIPYDDTWDRSGDVKRGEFHNRTIAYLDSHKIPYYLLSGSLETRVKKVKEVLAKHTKYENILKPYQ